MAQADNRGPREEVIVANRYRSGCTHSDSSNDKIQLTSKISVDKKSHFWQSKGKSNGGRHCGSNVSRMRQLFRDDSSGINRSVCLSSSMSWPLVIGSASKVKDNVFTADYSVSSVSSFSHSVISSMSTLNKLPNRSNVLDDTDVVSHMESFKHTRMLFTRMEEKSRLEQERENALRKKSSPTSATTDLPLFSFASSTGFAPLATGSSSFTSVLLDNNCHCIDSADDLPTSIKTTNANEYLKLQHEPGRVLHHLWCSKDTAKPASTILTSLPHDSLTSPVSLVTPHHQFRSTMQDGVGTDVTEIKCDVNCGMKTCEDIGVSGGKLYSCVIEDHPHDHLNQACYSQCCVSCNTNASSNTKFSSYDVNGLDTRVTMSSDLFMSTKASSEGNLDEHICDNEKNSKSNKGAISINSMNKCAAENMKRSSLNGTEQDKIRVQKQNCLEEIIKSPVIDQKRFAGCNGSSCQMVDDFISADYDSQRTANVISRGVIDDKHFENLYDSSAHDYESHARNIHLNGTSAIDNIQQSEKANGYPVIEPNLVLQRMAPRAIPSDSSLLKPTLNWLSNVSQEMPYADPASQITADICTAIVEGNVQHDQSVSVPSTQ